MHHFFHRCHVHNPINLWNYYFYIFSRKDKIFKIIEENFSKIAPYWFGLISSWLIRSYNVFQDIDKFIILIYFINKDLVFCRKNGLIIDYETFYNNKSIEIPKINISDISRDLIIPKESVRRKIQDLEKT